MADHERQLAAVRPCSRSRAPPGTSGTLPDLRRARRARTGAALGDLVARARAEASLGLRAATGSTSSSADLADAVASLGAGPGALERVTRLASFVEGKAADNRWQMRLSAYVLAYRLSQVVAAANERLAR